MSNGSPLLDLIIDIAEDKADRILVYPHSSASALALAFARKHCLPAAVVPHLVGKIRDSVRQLGHELPEPSEKENQPPKARPWPQQAATNPALNPAPNPAPPPKQAKHP
jgi:hypothetical protein